MSEPGLLEALRAAFEAEGVDLAALGLAWARAMPALALVPAFGLRALPAPARFAAALALAACVAPAVAAGVEPVPEGAWALALVREIARGLPVALAAAVPLWTATMAGSAVDALRGAGEGPSLATLEGRTAPLGALFGFIAALAFLASGGPSRVAWALASAPPPGATAALRVAEQLREGIGLAVAIAAPLAAASIVVEVALALIARAASPTQVEALIAQVRSVALLTLTALLFERIAAALGALGVRAGG
ncbi:MAG: flagellar biosynthetic protein FliR [Polyangiaceae bacterium]|jgi:type III secretory pathway component EscT|nr:flagellar biosynthetic protein FliR [Polyangiaceae bacterium]